MRGSLVSYGFVVPVSALAVPTSATCSIGSITCLLLHRLSPSGSGTVKEFIAPGATYSRCAGTLLPVRRVPPISAILMLVSRAGPEPRRNEIRSPLVVWKSLGEKIAGDGKMLSRYTLLLGSRDWLQNEGRNARQDSLRTRAGSTDRLIPKQS